MLTFLAFLLNGTGGHTVVAALQAQRTRTRIGLHIAIAPRALRVAAICGSAGDGGGGGGGVGWVGWSNFELDIY